jgi:hypothetical protein
MGCSFESCENLCRWRPVLELRVRKKDQPTKAKLTQIAYCEDHKKTLTIDDVLSDEGHTKIAKFMREHGKPAPVKRNITLTFEELTESEVEKLTPVIKKAKPDDDWLPF